MRVGSLTRILLPLLLITSLCIPALHAATTAKEDFTVEYEKVDNVISLNESATFSLQIQNNLEIAADFLIYSGDVSWEVATDPWEERQLTVGPQKSKEVTVVVSTDQNFWPSLYGVPVKVKNVETGQVITSQLLLRIRGNETALSGSYLPAVKSQINVPDKVDPREGIPFTIQLENQNRRTLERLMIEIRSDLMNREYETDLKKQQRKELEYLVELDPLTPPQKDYINAVIEVPAGNKTFTFRAQSDTYKIIAYGKIQEETESTRSFLKRGKVITLENTGNVPREYEYRTQKHFLDGLFFKADPEPETVMENGTSYYVWEGTLDVEGKKTISTQMSFRWIALVIVLVVIALGLYFTLRSPILITKKAYLSGRDDEGKRLVTIQIFIKNRTARKIYDAEIKDRLPNMFTVSQTFDLGTIQPKKILKHEERGTILKWDIDEIDAFEERIITYRASSKLSILGNLSLPRTVIKFKRKRIGRRYYAHSPIFSMSLEQ